MAFMRSLSWIFILLLATLPVAHAKVVVSCGGVGKELDSCRRASEEWARKNQQTVEIIEAPSSSSERLSQYQLLLAAQSPDIDVFLIDTTWPGMLADFFVDLREAAG